MRIAWYALAVLLAAIAAFLTVAAGGALSDSLRNHEDMSGAAYIGFGVGYLAVAVLFAAAALQTVSETRHAGRWLALTLAAMVCSAFPYAALVGWPAYALNAVLALLALGSATAYLRSPARP
jgi:hypothetical protein